MFRRGRVARPLLAVLVGCALFTALPPSVRGFSVGPLPGRANNPPDEINCSARGCHDSFIINQGLVIIRLTDTGAAQAFARYTPDLTYQLELAVSSTERDRLRWGFHRQHGRNLYGDITSGCARNDQRFSGRGAGGASLEGSQ